MAKTRSEIQAKYDAKHRQTITINLHNDNDADIIDMLNSVESKQGYIKKAIRAYMESTGSAPENTCSVSNSPVPVSFRDPYSDKIADAVGTWIDNATSVLTDEKPYIIHDSVPFSELMDREKNK